MTTYQYKSVRRNLQLSQPQFGYLVGASESTVSKWENKKQKPGTLQYQLYKLLKGAKWDFVQTETIKNHLEDKKNLRALAYIIFEAYFQRDHKT